MRILVIGGCGYIGSHTAVELLNSGYEVRLLDNLENSSVDVVDRIKEITSKEVEFVKGDIREIEELKKAMDGIEAVIHFAAYKSVMESIEKPLEYFENNVIGTYNILKAMKEKGIDKIVFSSSAAVYGNPKNITVTEDDDLDPLTPYGRNKLCMELLLQDAVNIGIDSVALRYFNAAGAHKSGKLGEDPNSFNNLIPRVFKASKNEYHLVVRGDKYDTRDGSGVRDYVHVSDLAEGHLKALEWLVNQDGKFEVFNLCSGEGATVMEIVKGVEQVTGREIDYEIGEADPSEAVVVTGSYEKAKKILGWEPQRKIDSILEDANRWYDTF